MSCGLFEIDAGDAARAAVTGLADAAAEALDPCATVVPPSTLIGVGSLRRVTYCSFTGSKYENAKRGSSFFFSLGESTISNVLLPLIPTSSSCLNLEEGGYLCQPCSSSKTGPLTRSKLPRPEIVVVTVIGSPTCTVFGFASVAIENVPMAPEKLAGALGGNCFTSSVTGALLISTSRRSPNWLNGLEKNGSANGSS